ncbi:MAG TPA: hypothetical protein VFQ53_41015 [Kofleriaceae bacterium]|nr:hypothetical protein [Kofleriaceae bacterium]
MRALAVTLASILISSVGCSKHSSDGLPPATEWSTADPAAAGAVELGGKPRAVAPSNDPHAGMDIGRGEAEDEDSGDDPHGGMFGGDPGGDPHAGVPGAPPIPGGGGGGAMPPTVDVTQLGLSSPDPNRAIDPNRRIRGTLKVHPKAKDKLKPGAAIFLIVKRPGPDGQPAGSPLAVDKLTWSADGMAFELTERQAMVAGTELTGEVIVMARVDQDSDAITKQPGDVTGMTRVKIPADGVVLELDTVLQ